MVVASFMGMIHKSLNTGILVINCIEWQLLALKVSDKNIHLGVALTNLFAPIS